MKLKEGESIFAGIWRTFGEDRKDNRAKAYARLQQNHATNADELVPSYYTAKEFLAVMAEMETYTKSDQQSDSGDPLTLLGEWIRGDVDLSRTPFSGQKKVA